MRRLFVLDAGFPVPMHVTLAAILQKWRQETMYAQDADWVFPSIKLRGRQPRTATTMVSDYIRPRALELKIIEATCSRFGFHNFRHSLATFLLKEGRNPDVVRQMLRQNNVDTTLLYAHMDDERIHAQGRLLQQMIPSAPQ